ncbi:MAG: glycerol-3-phosphate 1-O-acyltransferase PlsY [Desulfobacteraceae bacterium]|nr:glycerol-3-phosphate 1-O-acyltransferase PlsY [Desulfobacteraceae bacterium]
MGYHWIPYAIVAYLLGSVPFGKFIARGVGRIDITTRGSRNIGATNVARELGLKWGFLTLVLDILKGFVPVVLFASYIPDTAHSHEIALPLVGLSALLGHQFSLFERFRGGKGAATALGIFLGIAPLSSLLAICLFILVVYKWNIVSLGSMISASAMPFFLVLFHTPQPLVIFSLVVAALILIKHKDNIRRLLRGEETKWRNRTTHPRSSRSLSNSSSE